VITQSSEVQKDSSASSAPAPSDAKTPLRAFIGWVRSGGSFLFISLAFHALLLLVAGVWVVQNIQAKRKLTFSAGPQQSSTPSRQLEHRVQVAKRTSSMSAPALPNRIVSSAPNVKVALPQVPLTPLTSIAIPQRIGGLTSNAGAFKSNALGAKLSVSTTLNVPSPVGTFAGSAANFGMKPSTTTGQGLVGTMYYMRKEKDGKPIPLYSEEEYLNRIVQLFGNKGVLDEKEAGKYLRAGQQLTSFMMLFPPISQEVAPKAFGIEQVQDHRQCWFATYKGKISIQSPNRFRFIGGGNEILIVIIDGNVVLDGSWSFDWPGKGKAPTGNRSAETVGFSLYGDRRSIGRWFKLAPTGSNIEIIIGAGYRGAFSADLCVEEDGQVYEGNVRPLFKLEGYQKMQKEIDAAFQLPEIPPAVTLNGPTFKAR
jgi:hypothetical protein